MRILNLLLLLTISTVLHGQVNNPFLKLKFDKVVFYDFEEIGEEGSQLVDDNGKTVQKIIKQVQLDTSMISKLNSKLGDKRSYGNVTASCFDPHCGFVYFLNGKPVAQILICIDCNRLRSDIDIPAKKQGKQGTGADTYYIADGLSKSMRKFINGLLIKYKFTHQIEPGSSFDK